MSPPITPRPDLAPLSGGRGGQRVPYLVGPPNSAVRGHGKRVFITDAQGHVVIDLTRERAKPVVWGRGFAAKRMLTEAELDLLDRMGL